MKLATFKKKIPQLVKMAKLVPMDTFCVYGTVTFEVMRGRQLLTLWCQTDFVPF